MALIVPEAQTPFSPVEQPRMNPNAPNLGDGLQGLAETGINIVAARQKAEADRTLRSARLDALERLDEARLRYETDTNLDGLADRWAAESARITQDVAAALPAHLRPNFELAMREMVAPQTGAIRRRERALWVDQETAAMNADLRRYEAAAAAAPTDEARAAVLRDAAGVVGAAQDAGLLSAVEAERMLADLPANADRVAALRMVDEDPEGFLDMRASGAFAALPPQEAARLELAARGAATAEAARRAREDELVAQANDRELSARADAAIKVIEGGMKVENLPGLLADLEGTPHRDRVQAALDDTGTTANFALLPPARQAEELARLRETPTGNPADVGRVNRLAGIAENTRKSVERDRLAHVRDRGILPVEPVDVADPQSVQRRIAVAETVHREFTPEAREILYFDRGEADALRAELEGTDPDRALAVVNTIARTFGDRAPAALAQLGATDPTLHLAAVLPTETGDIAAARAVFEGRILHRKNEGAAVAAEVRRAVQSEVADAFGDRQALATALAAADAHYRATALGIADPKSDEAREAYRRSLQAVTAQTTRGDTTLGGVQPVNGRPTLLPPDLDPARVERALAAPDFGESAWRRASATGEPPRWGEQTFVHDMSRRDRERLTILALPDGSYALGARMRDGSVRYMRDPAQKDGVFRFDLRAFVTGVAQR